MAKYLDETGLAALWAKVKALVTANKYTHPSYTAKSSGLYKVTVDGTGHVSATTAVAKTDITALGIPSSDTTYSVATTSANGLMSSTDKTKLDGVATGANNYTHPSYTSKASGLYKVTVDSTGHVSATTAVAKSDITALGIPDSNTTYSVATTSANGLMSSTDKTKLDGIATGANNYVHPTTAGNIHIPSGGASGNILSYSGTSGTAQWEAPATTIDSSTSFKLVTASAVSSFVNTQIDSLSDSYAKKSDIVDMYKYKGSVADASKLPTSGQTTGDVYNIESASEYGGAGMNVAWNGSAWDALGEIFTITSITSSEIDTICV